MARLARTAAVTTVRVYAADDLKWHTAGKTGLSLKPVREDREKGLFLGLVGFEPLTRSGLHQHLDCRQAAFENQFPERIRAVLLE